MNSGAKPRLDPTSGPSTDAYPIRTALIGQRSLHLAGIVATVVRPRFELVLQCEDFAQFRAVASHVQPSLCLYVVRIGRLPEAVDDIAALRRSTPALRILASSEHARGWSVLRTAGADAHVLTDISPETLLSRIEAVMGTPPTGGSQGDASQTITQPFPRYADPFAGLSAREMEIVSVVAEGQSNKGVARQLSIAEPTVKAHMRAILRKTGVTNRTQLALWLSRRQHEPAFHQGFHRSTGILDPELRRDGQPAMAL